MQNDFLNTTEPVEHIDMSSDVDMHVSHDGHHDHTIHQAVNYRREYIKFAAILVAIMFGAFMHFWTFDLSGSGFLDSFMGVFFLTFACFKLIGLEEFVMGFKTYDIVAKRFTAYAFAYPFIQLFFAGAYLVSGNRIIDILVIIVSAVSGYGVIKALRQDKKFECVCLGNVIKLPLSRIALIEDFGMAAMALVMLVTR